MTLSNDNFPKDWQLVILAALLFLLCLQACTTTKDLHQLKTTEQIITKSFQEENKSLESKTNTDTKTTAETFITEECDTAVSVWVTNCDTGSRGTRVLIPVKFKRITSKKEFTNQQVQKREQGNTTIVKKDQIDQKTELITRDKTVERTVFPWWVIAIIVVFILATVAVLIYRKKGF